VTSIAAVSASGGDGRDLLEAVRSLTASDVVALVSQLNATLQSGERGAACAQQLASLYRVVCVVVWMKKRSTACV
jgi:hypothetical protein